MGKIKLSELGTFKNGLNYNSGNVSNGGCKIVGIPDFADRYIADLRCLSEVDDAIVSDDYLLKKDDILFVRSNGNKALVGRTMIIGEINDRITYSGFCIRFRPDKNKVLPLFLLYLFKSPQFRRHFSKSQQTSINNLNQDTLGSIILDLPDLHTQEKIVRCIHSITRKIEINKSINDNLQHQLKLLYDYWFTQFDFPNENGKPYRASGGAMVWCDELQREIPKGWKVSTLSNIAVLQAKSVMPQEGTAYNHYSIPAFDDTHSPAVEDGEAIASNKYVVPDNSVLVSKLNPQFKRIWLIINSTDNAICSTEFLPVKATETGVYALYSLLNSDAFSVHLIQNASSSTGSRKRIDPDNCMSYKFPYDQKVFARFDKAIQPLLMKITGIPTETQALVALRDWLLPMLMNGQATISD